MPVLPDVPSMMVPPGLILPAFSAASSIAMPMRSFTLPPGFRYSSFATIVGRTPCAIRFRRSRHWKVADVDVLHPTLNQSVNAARADLVRMNVRGEIALQLLCGYWNEVRQHLECLGIGGAIVKHSENGRNLHTQTFGFVDECVDRAGLVMRHNLRQKEVCRILGVEHEFHLPAPSMR